VAAQAAQRLDVLVADLPLGQARGQHVEVELRVGARAGESANVYHEPGAGLLEQASQLGHGSGGMADGEERGRHSSQETLSRAAC